jgi:hypothetical protein
MECYALVNSVAYGWQTSGLPDKRLKEINKLETNVFFLSRVAVVAVPITVDTLLRYGEKFRIVSQELTVN